MSNLNISATKHLKRNIESIISDKEKKRMSNKIVSMLLAAVFLISGFIFKNVFVEQEAIAGIILIFGVVFASASIVHEAYKDFINNKYTMEQLVIIAIIASVLTGDYETAILIPIILSVVHFLEERSILGGKDAIESLKKIQVKNAILIDGDKEKEVDVQSLKKGDCIVIKPGMIIAIDGTILSGVSSVDQKSLTGESIPRDVKTNDKVYAGTLNMFGRLTVEVEKKVFDTSFSKILQFLEEAEKTTLPIIGLLDKFFVYYIPFIIIVSIMCGIVFQDISRAIAVLVASCPCAYVLANSSAMIAAIAASSKQGIVIKDSSFIETLSNVNTIIFDKTGTLTEGGLFIKECILKEAKSDSELIEIAATITHGSMHPVSKATTRMSCEKFSNKYIIEESAGEGIKGYSNNDAVLFGKREWLITLGYKIDENPKNYGPVNWVVKNKKIMGCILFNDRIREDAESVLSDLKILGISQFVLLSGDSKEATDEVQMKLNIEKAYSELMPNDKLKYVRLEKDNDNTVMVIGDGINDALALKEADIGIAMGAMGSDTAINSANIALMNNNLFSIPFIINLAMDTKKIIYQNILIAFLSSFLMIGLAAAGIISPVLGALLHNIGAFIVLLNSARILMNNKLLVRNTKKV